MNDAMLTAWSTEVLSLAATVRGEGRYDSRVFIAAVFAAYCAKHGACSRSLFDRILLQAHAAGLVSLNRADLVGAMPAKMVADSLVTHPAGFATFHFIVAP